MTTKKSIRITLLAATILAIAVGTSIGFARPASAGWDTVRSYAAKLGLLIGAEAAPAPVAARTVETPPAIATDRANYAEGETIVIDGAGWTPGETVKLDFWSSGVSMEVAADADGRFTASVAMPAEASQPAAAAKTKEVAEEGDALVITATGSVSGTSAQAEIRRRMGDDEEGGDADLPRFMVGRIEKEDYLRQRDEYINRRRGIEPGQPFDRAARSRAVQLLDMQSGIDGGKTRTLRPGSPSLDAFSNNTSVWTQIGPSPIPNGQTFSFSTSVTGRITAIAVHPINPDIIYVAAAQGGVYRSTDGGSNWTPLFDGAQTLAVGSIAIAPSQPSTIYVGTGEANNSCDSYFGVGVYRIDNADGAAPTMTGPFNQETGTGNDVMTGRSASKIVVHPTDPNTIFVGTGSGIGGIGCDQAPTLPSRGLYRSTNAGAANATFQKLAVFTANGGNRNVSDIEFEPDNPNNLLATVTGFNTAGDGGVYRSTNALAPSPAFTQTLVAGSASVSARVEIAINKVGAQVNVFAATSDASGTLKRSTDGGVTWSAALAGATGFCGGQCTYDMPVAVDPNNGDVVFIGGNADGVSSAIIKKSTNALTTATFAKAQDGLHADSHAIEVAPSNSSIVFTGNDGGIWRSEDAGANWVSRNTKGLNATQFQSIAVHPVDTNFTIGGTQDNGTNRINPDGTWSRTDFGDGGFALIDQNAVNTTTVRQYHTYFNQTNNLIGFGTTTNGAAFENWSFLGCGGTSNGISCTDSVEFYAPMALGPGNPNTLYFGTNKLYRSTNAGTTMAAVSQTLTSTITAIGISPQNDLVRIIGTRSGKVFRTTTGSSPLTDVTGTIPAKYVARAVIDPNNSNTAYVALAGYFGGSTAHVYKTTNLADAAPVWTALGGGTIPDVPVNGFVVDPANSSMLYAGTDVGVYRSVDGGATWTAFSNGLPRVAVFDMAIQNAGRILRVATHGRGMWELSIAATPGTLQGTITDSATGNPVGGAVVTAGSSAVTTDAGGGYQFTGIAAGTYSLTVTAAGYNAATVNAVTVTAGQTTTQNASLTSAAATGCATDTTRADFDAGVLNNTDDATDPGNLRLSAAPGVIDQQQTTLAFFVDSINTTNWQAQTFRAGSTGQLSAIDLQLAFATGGSAGTLVFEIRDTSAGTPGATVLGSATSTDVVGTSNAWYNIKFATPVPLVSGTTYAIVIRASSGGNFRAVRSSTNAYANGGWLSSANSGGAWTAQTTDLAFRTYMTPGLVGSGVFVSSVKDSNPAGANVPRWGTLSWTASAPAGTTAKFQAAASKSPVGPFVFVGPDGTPATFFASGASLAQFNGFRYLKYRANLATQNPALTPVVNDVTVCFDASAFTTAVAVDPASGAYGGTADLRATLTSGGSPLAGRTVVFTLGGNSFAGNTAVTDANGVATLPGASLAGINAGSYPQGVGASFAAGGGYAASSGANTLDVSRLTPSISWNNPADISYGTALGAAQLNAAASVPGTYVYTPAAGTVLNAGSGQPLHVDFAPTDAVNYEGASADVSINVLKAATTTTVVCPPSVTYTGAALTPCTASVAGPGLSQALTVSYADNTNAGQATASASFAETANYLASSDSRSFTIAKAATTTTVVCPPSVTFTGAALTPCTASVAGPALSQAVTIAYSNNTNAGQATATADYAESANYLASSDSRNFTIAKATSTTVVSGGGTFLFNGLPRAATVSVTGAGGLNLSPAPVYSGNCSAAPVNVADTPCTASYTFAGDPNHLGSSGSAVIVIQKPVVASSVSASPNPQQYSDQVALTATLTSAVSGGGVWAATNVTFYVGTQNMGTVALVASGADLTATLNAALLEGTAGQMAPGARTVRAVFGGVNPNFVVPEATNGLTITPENAAATYAGPSYFATASPTSTTANLTLSATVVDAADGSRGDIRRAVVEFRRDSPAGPLLGAAAPVGLVTAGDTTVGTATTSFSYTLSGSEVNANGATLTVYVVVKNYYAGTSGPESVTVTIPGSESVNGGGFLLLNASNGQYAGLSGSKMNFGFTMKYNKSGKNLQGQANIIIRAANGRTYQIKSNAIDSLAVSGTVFPKGASFTTKANMTDITDPLNPVAVGGNLSLQVDATDAATGGQTDQIGISVWNANGGGLVFSSYWNGVKTIQQLLGGGNVSVR